jgi:co-chaperonin GroES (HSP10)
METKQVSRTTEAISEGLAGISAAIDSGRRALVTTGWGDDSPIKPGDVMTVDVKEGKMLYFFAPLPFRPLHNQVVIRVLKEKGSIGSLFIPEAHNDNKQHGAIGMVVACGAGHRRKSILQTTGPNPTREWLGGYCPLPVEPGDYVVFARSSGEAHEISGQTFLLTPVEHIFCVLDGYDPKGREQATEREFGIESQMDKKWKRPASERPRVEGKRG